MNKHKNLLYFYLNNFDFKNYRRKIKQIKKVALTNTKTKNTP